MERHFDEDLRDLEKRVLEMGALCESMIHKAVKALIDRDGELTQEVFRMEVEANRRHVEIDEVAIKLIALHQPMAGDLRTLAAAMKINNDLERIADMAVNASQTGYYHLFNEPPVPQINMVTHMAQVAQTMLRNALDAYAKRDVDLAQRVLAQEKEEDRLKARALKELISLIRIDPPRSEVFVDLILLSKNMERIGDHATNIAEDVVYMVLGKDIRHLSTAPDLDVAPR
ncbi:MAG TPA: phosphate signaling complex protein PhoU [Elusimicrobiota bacterium]|nr:phosphate signaling complex protein PhoU [Elusimicrobiota bacterium]HNG44640.1 phosphate signaling complex protein PhoU [Elusimicrobiota bacterium]